MQIPRLFLDPECIDAANKRVVLADKQHVNQIKNVLRMRKGARIDVLNNQGQIYHCVLQSEGLKSCQLSIEESDTAGGEPSIKLTVALPVLKTGRFEWALEKLTELGAAKIVPLETERSVLRWSKESDSNATKGGESAKMVRWRSIVREAAEQCERAMIPDVVRPQPLTALLEDAKNTGGIAVLCAERRGAKPLPALLASESLLEAAPSLVVLIGPEGGFSENEFMIAEKWGVVPVSLGKRILRSETAAVYATALLMGHLDR